MRPNSNALNLALYKLGGLNTIWTVAAIQTVEVSSEALRLKRTGGRTTTDAVSVDKGLFTAVIYTHVEDTYILASLKCTLKVVDLLLRSFGFPVKEERSYRRKGSCPSTPVQGNQHASTLGCTRPRLDKMFSRHRS